jgi:hypothetical protein
MPSNTGRRPSAELVDIKLRNGHIVRDTDPQKWRWKPWPTGPHDFDILIYRVKKSD